MTCIYGINICGPWILELQISLKYAHPLCRYAFSGFYALKVRNAPTNWNLKAVQHLQIVTITLSIMLHGLHNRSHHMLLSTGAAGFLSQGRVFEAGADLLVN